MQTHHLLIFLSLIMLSCSSQKSISTKAEDNISSTDNFHLYLLMGQSNMAGRGKVEALDTLTHPRVYMLDKNMNWVLAKDPMHFDKSVAGTGLGLTFGKVMTNEDPNIKIGLIPTAVGGSSINQWFADSLFQQTNTYPYDDMIRRTKKAMESGTLKGILWHQGESDSNTENDLREYTQKFEAMQDSLKADLGLVSIPIVMGELGYFFYPKVPFAKEMNGVISQIAGTDDCIELVTAEGLTHKGDSIHFDSDSYHALGIRYATKMQEIQSKCSTIFKK
ncbi:sialate O-acetylesterase [Algoriphagus sp. D3-2-R+10]|uniref:sialate O-acetylesterase n=1 Tax=Algoriphagus aurantiacus TaxID=3103948 RepID=UPI002B3B5A76|nr:sialate O-acetylesterase [Algoriphagus sp. D3-2-R+10]MEB2776802.1 sialate O-acetylesterase [Algoriphagus sp. D3-2-R+10]